MRTLILAALGMVAAQPARATSCMEVPPQPQVLAARGGIVVANVSGVKYAVDPLAVWRFRGGGKPVVRNIAPGLDVLVTDGPAVLEDDKQRVIAEVVAGKPGPALAAPVPKAVKLTGTGPLTVEEHWLQHVIITVDVPADAVALVAFDETGKRPLYWGQAGAPAKSVMIYEGGSCGSNPTGTAVPFAGDKIRLAWLDTSGRLSSTSPLRGLHLAALGSTSHSARR